MSDGLVLDGVEAGYGETVVLEGISLAVCTPIGHVQAMAQGSARLLELSIDVDVRCIDRVRL